MTINISLPEHTELKPKITVIGVGGAGGNAVNNMIRSNLEGVEFLVTNTDSQALAGSLADRRIQLGATVTQGLGAGSRPEVGRAAAEEAIEEIMEHLEGSNMVFITAGMGGGTGTGAAPVIAQSAREHGILTVGVVTKPFHFEGQHRMRVAEEGIDELAQLVDTLIIIPNQNLFRIANEKTTFADAFKMADDVLHSGVRGVTDLMVMPGLINLDFADIRTVMSEMGKAMMGTGEASGDKRALDAAEAAINNPLLEDMSMKGARGVLINITGGYDMTLFEVDEAANRIRDEVDPNANIIFGSTFDEKMSGTMRVSVVATGINAESMAQRPPRPALSLVSTRQASAAAAASPAAAAAAFAATGAPLAGRAATALKLDVDAVATTAAEPQAAVADGALILEETAPTAELEPVAEPATAPSTTGEPPAPAPRREEAPYVAPRPAMPAGRPPIARNGAAEPFAAAALANAGERERPKAPSLFRRMTGLARPRPAETTATTTAPESASPRQAPAPAVGRSAERAAEPSAQPRLGRLDPGDRVKASQDEDLLDIPAFLRRQAN